MIRAVLCLALACPAAAQEAPALSGSAFLTPETRALQEDDFANPGMFWVEQGATLWEEAAPGGSCRACHGAPETLRGAGTRYPRWAETQGRVVTLEHQIRSCRERQGLPPPDYGSEQLLALSALVMHQSRGLPMTVATDGPAAAAYAAGEAYFRTPRGQLDLSCANCHVDHVGQRLRGEVISQGQVNGFPVYRQLWQDMGSVGRMIAWCNTAVRAEPLAEGSEMAVALELYLRARGAGLPIEAPGVRR